MDKGYRAALVWGGGAALWLGALLAVTPITGFLLAPAADTVIGASPGWLATAAIEAFGKAAKPLLAASIALAAVGAAAAAGYLQERYAYSGGSTSLSFLSTATAGVVLYVTSSVPLRLVGVIAGFTTGVPPALFVYLNRRTPGLRTDHARRAALRRVAAGITAVGGLGMLSRIGVGDSGDTGASRADDVLSGQYKRDTGRTIETSTAGDDSVAQTDGTGFDFRGMPPRIETIEDHYIVDVNTQDPVVNSDSWKLDITGAVETPYTLSLDSLIEHPEAVSVPITMVCISNPVGGGLISTCTWQGVPLDAVLDRAGVRETGVDVVTKAVDGYSEAIPVETAREMDAFVAFGADGETLPISHGFPARLQIPGRYGMKSTKWLTEIEISTREHDAYWEARGWDERAVINTLSYVRAAAVKDGEVAVGGVAYAGVRGIQTVEVSRDGGDSWHEAELEAPPSEYAWRRWRRLFPVPDGDRMEITVRAVDGTGALQTGKRSPPHPDGSTGWHRRTFSL